MTILSKIPLLTNTLLISKYRYHNIALFYKKLNIINNIIIILCTTRLIYFGDLSCVQYLLNIIIIIIIPHFTHSKIFTAVPIFI